MPHGRPLKKEPCPMSEGISDGEAVRPHRTKRPQGIGAERGRKREGGLRKKKDRARTTGGRRKNKTVSV